MVSRVVSMKHRSLVIRLGTIRAHQSQVINKCRTIDLEKTKLISGLKTRMDGNRTLRRIIRVAIQSQLRISLC
jgi:hypothetical protein